MSSQTKKKESEKKSESKLRAFIKRSSEPLINFQNPQVLLIVDTTFVVVVTAAAVVVVVVVAAAVMPKMKRFHIELQTSI